MAALEEEGYIAQPHTSAGRVPTDKGYRLFVDRLSTIKPMTVAERRAIQQFMAGAVDLDGVIQRTVRLLAQLTRQVAVVQYPSLAKTTLRHVGLLMVGGNGIMIVLVTSSGPVQQRIIQGAAPPDQSTPADMRARVNATVTGPRYRDIGPALADLPLSFEHDDRSLVRSIVAV